MGCDADWQPGCADAQLKLDADSVWKGTFALPAGEYEYKAAINRSWDENYGAGGAAGGANITYTVADKPVTFYYEHARHYVTSDAEGPIITAPGSMQSELGCAADWDPSCMATWLIDPERDGVYTWSSTELPAGNYEMKVAHGLSWAESYGNEGANVKFSVPRAGVQVAISYNIGSHEIVVSSSEPGVAPDLRAAKAIWLAPDLIAWPVDAKVASDAFRLHWAPEGMTVGDAGLSGESVSLVLDQAGLPDEMKRRFPHLARYAALRVDSVDAARAKQLLTGQVAVGRYAADGKLLDGTGIQIAPLLDRLYAPAAEAQLGVSLARPVARLWAPTARNVTMLIWPGGQSSEPTRLNMSRDDATGIWSTTGDSSWSGAHYLYEVEVFVPSTGRVEKNLVTDPYSVGLTLNSRRSVMVDLNSPTTRPPGWESSVGPKLASPVDQTIYELHVRDFSVNDPAVPEELRGSYKAFGVDGNGRKHLRRLAEAGLNTVHLLPTFDIATIEEDPSKQLKPECNPALFAPDSPEMQKCIADVADKDAFNWGYDPFHYMTPEGSYASTAAAADGGQRTREFREMVAALHSLNLRVVLDQVYNHTTQSGQGERSVLDRVVPGYYHRLNADGGIENSTCCENIATENAMAQKLMVDSVVLWAKHYRVDGFRFDLMGHHSTTNMAAVRRALDELTPERDGVDGKAITLYGEGWDFGEVGGNARFEQAKQGQLAGTSIGTFNDRLRDGVRGGGPFDADPRTDRGFATTGDNADDLDLVQIGLAGNLADFQLRSQKTREVVPGSKIDYNGAPAGYAAQPDEVVNYVDAHDNETLFDMITFKVPTDLPMSERIRLNTLALATTTLSQSASFWHAGTDMLRSKSLDRDSYNSGDWFNLLDFTMADNGFGRGLPPAGKNKDKWAFMAPLLANPANKPSSEQISQASAMAQDLLRLRATTKLFRLGDADLIRQKLSFPVSGTEHGSNQVIVLRVDDSVGPDADPRLKQLVAVFNASGADIEQRVPGLEGAPLVLNDVQAQGADPVAKRASWDAATATARVPARTVAVFWETQPVKPSEPKPSEPKPSKPGRPGLPRTGQPG
ncbi:pullulanase-type alpha-1,6-glucosidase [Tessaracoccus sp. OH4464_COT-324]|nr:pullulanase-type alpha-1,6-glucosidase [Tessaracoccus sp. OH4464_COT-324]